MNLTFSNIRHHTATAPPLPSLGLTLEASGHTLTTTRHMLRGAQLAARTELTNLGLPTTTYLDTLLPPRERDPFLIRLINAVHSAAAANAFAPSPAPAPTRPGLVPGARVRLERRPPEAIGLPTRIPLGTLGVLINEEDYPDWGPGWEILFDEPHGTWWTTTASLELA